MQTLEGHTMSEQWELNLNLQSPSLCLSVIAWEWQVGPSGLMAARNRWVTPGVFLLMPCLPSADGRMSISCSSWSWTGYPLWRCSTGKSPWCHWPWSCSSSWSRMAWRTSGDTALTERSTTPASGCTRSMGKHPAPTPLLLSVTAPCIFQTSVLSLLNHTSSWDICHSLFPPRSAFALSLWGGWQYLEETLDLPFWAGETHGLLVGRDRSWGWTASSPSTPWEVEGLLSDQDVLSTETSKTLYNWG